MRFWISDNDLQKLAESVDEARNIRMSTRRTHLRVHAVEVPALDELAMGKCECGRPASRYDSDAVALCDECYDALPLRPNL